MEFQIENAHVVKGTDSVQVCNGSITVTFRHEKAQQLEAEYQKQVSKGVRSWDLRLRLEIEVENPTGERV